MFAIATDAAIGWPANVRPCRNDAVPSRNGSAILSRVITQPIGAYADVMPFAVVIMSGW